MVIHLDAKWQGCIHPTLEITATLHNARLLVAGDRAIFHLDVFQSLQAVRCKSRFEKIWSWEFLCEWVSLWIISAEGNNFNWFHSNTTRMYLASFFHLANISTKCVHTVSSNLVFKQGALLFSTIVSPWYYQATRNYLVCHQWDLVIPRVSYKAYSRYKAAEGSITTFWV